MTGDGDLLCDSCGRGPAAPLLLRGQMAIVFSRKVELLACNACRDCGLAMARITAAHNLVWGWWGVIAALKLPVVLVRNRLATRAVRRLPPPEGVAVTEPLDPGRPIYLRKAAVVPAVLLAGATFVVVVGLTTTSVRDLRAGACADLPTRPETRSFVDGTTCGTPHDAEVVGLVAPGGGTTTARCAQLASETVDNTDGALRTLVLDPQGEDPPVCLVVRVDGEPLVGRVERRTETGS